MGLVDFIKTGRWNVEAKAQQKYPQPQVMILGWTPDGQIVWYDNTGQNRLDLGYLGNHIIFSIQDWKSSKVALAPPSIYEVVDDKKYQKYRTLIKSKHPDSFRKAQDLRYKALEEVGDHPAMKVLDNPNPMMSRYEFEYGMQVYIDMVGSGYYLGVRDGISDPTTGKIKEMWLPPAHYMTAKMKGLEVDKWFLSSNPTQDIDAKNVCQIRNFSPQYNTGDQWIYGLSRLYAAQSLIQKYSEGQKTEVSLYQNKGMRDFVFPKGKLDENEATVEQSQSVKDTMTRKIVESGNGGIVGSNVELGTIRVGFSPTELGILDTLSDAKGDFCAMYHIPPAIFGWGENSTYNNMEQYIKTGIRDAVLPELERRKDAYNSWLIPSYNEKGKFVVDYDLDYFPELQDDKESLVKWMKEVPLTGNERRIAVGYDSHIGEGMDTPIMSNGYSRIEDMGTGSFDSTTDPMFDTGNEPS